MAAEVRSGACANREFRAGQRLHTLPRVGGQERQNVNSRCFQSVFEAGDSERGQGPVNAAAPSLGADMRSSWHPIERRLNPPSQVRIGVERKRHLKVRAGLAEIAHIRMDDAAPQVVDG